LAVYIFLSEFLQLKQAAPGPWLRAPDSLFHQSENLEVVQEFLADKSKVSNLTVLVREIVMAFSAHVSTNEVLKDEFGASHNGYSVHSSPDSIFNSGGIKLLSLEELHLDTPNNYAVAILFVKDNTERLYACVAHITGSQINLGPATQVQILGSNKHVPHSMNLTRCFEQ
jgi:hypothetical protein